MNIPAARGVYLPRLANAPSRDASSIQNTNSTASARTEFRHEVNLPVSVEGVGQPEQDVVSAYERIRTQQIRGYMHERLPWSPSVREGMTAYKDIGGQGRADEAEALGVDFYV